MQFGNRCGDCEKPAAGMCCRSASRNSLRCRDIAATGTTVRLASFLSFPRLVHVVARTRKSVPFRQYLRHRFRDLDVALILFNSERDAH